MQSETCLNDYDRSSVWRSLVALASIIIFFFAFVLLWGAFILGPRQEAQLKKIVLSEGITPEAIYIYPRDHNIDLEEAVTASLRGESVSEVHTIAVRAGDNIVVLSVTVETIKVLPGQPAEAQPENQ